MSASTTKTSTVRNKNTGDTDNNRLKKRNPRSRVNNSNNNTHKNNKNVNNNTSDMKSSSSDKNINNRNGNAINYSQPKKKTSKNSSNQGYFYYNNFQQPLTYPVNSYSYMYNPVYYYPQQDPRIAAAASLSSPYYYYYYPTSPQIDYSYNYNNYPGGTAYTHVPYNNNTAAYRSSSSVQNSNFSIDIPRGPPKKPKQSGHAIWIGNLPHFTTLEDLRKAFGTMEIESIFLIERTNCAFVNYSSFDGVSQGIRKFRKRCGSQLRGNKLLIKRQYDSRDNNNNDDNGDNDSSNDGGEEGADAGVVVVSSQSASIPSNQVNREKNRYFVCKSLTFEDLEASAKFGIWSPQSQYEELFNKAFRESENVYLFFSANRGGEYYGYARMESETKPRDPYNFDNKASTSSLNNDNSYPSSPISSPILQSLPSVISAATSSTNNSQLPKITPTPADKSIPIPAGRIVDDSSRGSLFWEVVTNERAPVNTEVYTGPEDKLLFPSSKNNSWTSAFDIRWLSRQPLPFVKTLHLRNPYNENKLVKIARDGTEIEPYIGAQLVELFNSN